MKNLCRLLLSVVFFTFFFSCVDADLEALEKDSVVLDHCKDISRKLNNLEGDLQEVVQFLRRNNYDVNEENVEIFYREVPLNTSRHSLETDYDFLKENPYNSLVDFINGRADICPSVLEYMPAF